MVSSVDTVRIWSMQTANRVFRETANEDAGQDSMASRLLSSYGIDSGDETDAKTYSLADILSGSSTSGAAVKDEAPVSTDIESTSFMEGLKAKLEALKASPATRAQAEDMLKALAEGKLTVTDAANGQQIKAWDVEAEDVTPGTKTRTDATDWSTFLRDNLARNGGGTYQRSADGSNIDRKSGANAYFGTIGDAYYYLTWPAASAGEVTIQA